MYLTSKVYEKVKKIQNEKKKQNMNQMHCPGRTKVKNE